MPAADYQPPLRWWNHAWRYALVLTISGVAWFEIAYWQWDHNRLWFWSDLGLGLVGLVALQWRRRFPVAVAVFTNAASFVSWSSAGPGTLALVSLSTRRRWREVIPLGVLAIVASLVAENNNPVSEDVLAFTIPFIIAIIGVSVGWGMYIGSRRELLTTLRERARTAESEQAARVAQARTAERGRIAREMHDVLAHRISLVTMHAGALTYREDLTAEEMRATAAVIQESSHQALVELRDVLGILRDDAGDASPERPQPSAVDLPALLDEARATGMRIETEELVALDGIPETLGRTLYRVVQESLTNARKHAPNTLVTVSVTGSPWAGLTIVVTNPLEVGSSRVAVPESGLGLIGLAERTALVGGKLSHRITPGREFVVEAWLPWPA
ncbi:sensor histidine kinase [Aeromicrobium ginsengisoli]|uniref:histidine kinase n=1 Tax=Aeromicrobium ginsengisoli TaxID=363867 RepID=A0A5M4FFF7_9ACTN|nr:histidine kinase [Aeromicrobium ginsengisoli]KAA1398085.1 two-component sensor histidine kinase [Aeromicrobium ginsengisoli]